MLEAARGRMHEFVNAKIRPKAENGDYALGFAAMKAANVERQP